MDLYQGIYLHNRDQRIVVDVHRLAETMGQFAETFVLAPFLILLYSYACLQLMGITALACIYLYFLLGALMLHYGMSMMTDRTVRVDAAEGDFRYAYSQARQASEPIVLSGCQHAVQGQLSHIFTSLLQATLPLLLIESTLTMGRKGLAYAGAILNYLLILWGFLRGQGRLEGLDSGAIAQLISLSSFYTLYLIGVLTGLLEVSNVLSQMSAHAMRVQELFDLIESHQSQRDLQEPNDPNRTLTQSTVSPPPYITYSSISMATPDGRLLIENFNLCIKLGQHTCILGPNGSGKTSLIRLLLHLWRPLRGSLVVMAGATIGCAPQEAVIHSGSLLQQLGLPETMVDEERVVEALKAVRLVSLPMRMDGWYRWWPRTRWVEMLSPGELQRLALARLLVNPPTFAVLDEATSAVDETTESVIYEELWIRGITTITVGHRIEPFLADRLSIQVIFDGHGAYQVLHKN